MTSQHLFIFGRDPVLSLAELCTLNESLNTKWLIESHWKNAALVSGSLDANALQAHLGGTVKIARLLNTADKLTPDGVFETLDSQIKSLLANKFYFGLSFFGNPSENERSKIEEIFKQYFKSNGVKAMLKNPRSDQQNATDSMSPSQIHSLELLDAGFDFCIAKHEGTWYLARSVSATNPAELKQRDITRFKADEHSATSIRLARILINLAGVSRGATILDPFCGIGTILLEASRMGFLAIGIDENPKAIALSEKNKKKLLKTSPGTQIQLYRADSRKLASLSLRFDAVVTEPTLGPYLRRKPSSAHAKRILQELEPLFAGVFQALAQQMKPGANVVILLPQFETLDGHTHSFSSELFFTAGFESINPISFPAYAGAFPYLYRTPNNKINRQLYILRRKFK